jgi:hypothetical protein
MNFEKNRCHDHARRDAPETGSLLLRLKPKPGMTDKRRLKRNGIGPQKGGSTHDVR